MTNEQLPQDFDETLAGAGTAPEAASGTRRVQRRSRARAAEAQHEAAETAEAVRSSVRRAADETGLTRNSTVEAARTTGAKLGCAVRYVRDVQAEDVVISIKDFVRRHPSSLFGAAVAGFLLGRMLRSD